MFIQSCPAHVVGNGKFCKKPSVNGALEYSYMSEASREQDNNSNLRCVANPNYGTWLLRDCGGDGNKFDAATAAVRPITPDGGGSFCAGRRPSGAHTAAVECPLLGVKRTLIECAPMS